ncbi:MAG: Putative oxidoreductase, partial [uncultured Gemmatimonadetes bacterium]
AVHAAGRHGAGGEPDGLRGDDLRLGRWGRLRVRLQGGPGGRGRAGGPRAGGRRQLLQHRRHVRGRRFGVDAGQGAGHAAAGRGDRDQGGKPDGGGAGAPGPFAAPHPRRGGAEPSPAGHRLHGRVPRAPRRPVHAAGGDAGGAGLARRFREGALRGLLQLARLARGEGRGPAARARLGPLPRRGDVLLARGPRPGARRGALCAGCRGRDHGVEPSGRRLPLRQVHAREPRRRRRPPDRPGLHPLRPGARIRPGGAAARDRRGSRGVAGPGGARVAPVAPARGLGARGRDQDPAARRQPARGGAGADGRRAGGSGRAHGAGAGVSALVRRTRGGCGRARRAGV